MSLVLTEYFVNTRICQDFSCLVAHCCINLKNEFRLLYSFVFSKNLVSLGMDFEKPAFRKEINMESTCLSCLDMKITKSSLHRPNSQVSSRKASEKSSAAFFFCFDDGFLRIGKSSFRSPLYVSSFPISS